MNLLRSLTRRVALIERPRDEAFTAALDAAIEALEAVVVNHDERRAILEALARAPSRRRTSRRCSFALPRLACLDPPLRCAVEAELAVAIDAIERAGLPPDLLARARSAWAVQPEENEEESTT